MKNHMHMAIKTEIMLMTTTSTRKFLSQPLLQLQLDITAH